MGAASGSLAHVEGRHTSDERADPVLPTDLAGLSAFGRTSQPQRSRLPLAGGRRAQRPNPVRLFQQIEQTLVHMVPVAANARRSPFLKGFVQSIPKTSVLHV